MKRREFLHCVEAGAVAAGALSLGGCLGFHYVNSSVVGGRLIVNKADFGKSRYVLVDAPGFQLPLYIGQDPEAGGYVALSTRCMHRGCQVEPTVDHFVCPCHGSEYSGTGAVLKGPTQRPLRRLAVTDEGDRLAIQLPPGGDAL